jgi:hypothetical protein
MNYVGKQNANVVNKSYLAKNKNASKGTSCLVGQKYKKMPT